MAVESHQVLIKVTKIMGTGTCPNHHCVGDTFTVTGAETVEGLCGWAYHAMLPFLTVLRFGGEFPWEDDKDKAIVCCPDPSNPVVFEIKRRR